MIINSSAEIFGQILQNQWYSNRIFFGDVVKKKERLLSYVVSRGAMSFQRNRLFYDIYIPISLKDT
jgi:hypothetical protein